MSIARLFANAIGALGLDVTAAELKELLQRMQRLLGDTGYHSRLRHVQVALGDGRKWALGQQNCVRVSGQGCKAARVVRAGLYARVFDSRSTVDDLPLTNR